MSTRSDRNLPAARVDIRKHKGVDVEQIALGDGTCVRPLGDPPLHKADRAIVVAGFVEFAQGLRARRSLPFDYELCLPECEGVSLDGVGVVGHLHPKGFDGVGQNAPGVAVADEPGIESIKRGELRRERTRQRGQRPERLGRSGRGWMGRVGHAGLLHGGRAGAG